MNAPFTPFSIIRSKRKFSAKVETILKAPKSGIYQKALLNQGISLEVGFRRMFELKDGFKYAYCNFINKADKNETEKKFISESTKNLEVYAGISLMIKEETFINDFELVSEFDVNDLDPKKRRQAIYALELFIADKNFPLPFNQNQNIKIKEVWETHQKGFITESEFINNCLRNLDQEE